MRPLSPGRGSVSDLFVGPSIRAGAAPCDCGLPHGYAARSRNRQVHRFSVLCGRCRRGVARCPICSSALRYGLALLLVIAAYLTAMLLEVGTGKFTAFPFYAAVVAGAWLGVGPGLLSFVLSSVVAADCWTPTQYSLELEPVDLPSFAAFVVFALMSLAWSMQRRHAQHALERTVRQRTAELVQANLALKAEMAEREATERALRDAEAELARTLRLATMAELAAAIAHEVNQPLAAITANGSAIRRCSTMRARRRAALSLT